MQSMPSRNQKAQILNFKCVESWVEVQERIIWVSKGGKEGERRMLNIDGDVIHKELLTEKVYHKVL